MGDIRHWTPNAIRSAIRLSNIRARRTTQGYLMGENRAIEEDYDFIPCPCSEECWCQQNGCSGHYRIKNITFSKFLETYVALWIPPKARQIVKDAVVWNRRFEGRQRNAPRYLKRLEDNWSSTLSWVRGFDRCGLCDSPAPEVSHVSNLYEAKMWSQLFYDSVLPFDTGSRTRIIRANYPDPKADFMETNRQVASDLREVAEKHQLSLIDIRGLDVPWEFDNRLSQPVGGQPLSRVMDKMFYST